MDRAHLPTLALEVARGTRTRLRVADEAPTAEAMRAGGLPAEGRRDPGRAAGTFPRFGT